MLLVYGDDSTDEKRERVCAVAGVVGTIPGWRALEREWLVRTGGIPFHAKDCDSDRGDYKGSAHRENKDLYRDLAIMTAESHVAGFGVAIDLIALRRIFPGSEDIAYYRAFLRVMERMKDCAEENSETAEFTFDMRMESEHNSGLLYESVRENEPEWTNHVAERITFEFSRNNPRLQVADLIARESMKALDNRIGPQKRISRRSWDTLHDSGRFKIEAYSDEWFEDLKRHMGQLEQKVGFCEKDYTDWLVQRKRNHNMTNLILFVDSIARRDKCNKANQ